MRQSTPALRRVPRIDVPEYDPEIAEETKVITVRLPKSFHTRLRAQAYEQHTSLNKLAVAKLFGEALVLEEDLTGGLTVQESVPGEKAKKIRRGVFSARPTAKVWSQLCYKKSTHQRGKRL